MQEVSWVNVGQAPRPKKYLLVIKLGMRNLFEEVTWPRIL
jgi:hypothetical protein